MLSVLVRPPRAARRRTALCCLVHATLAALLVAGPQGADAATYYFSAAGDDVGGDGSQNNPWRSINRFNALDLNPGDSVLFRAGDQFTGKMWLDSNDAGTDAFGRLIAPVRIGSYGTSGSTPRAKIVSPFNGEAFVAHNAGGVELSDLEFVSGGFSSQSRTNGVRFLSDGYAPATTQQLEHVRVNNVVSRGFGLSGLDVWAHSTVGFSDVVISDSEFHSNGYAGVYVGATNWHQKYHADVVVERVVAHNNPGYVGPLPYTGHGVILANTNGGAIRDSVAHDNGKVYGNANVGLWTYQSNSVVIERNLAFGNRSPGGFDGGAFDIDGGVTNSIIQYNQSFDNDGAGLLLAEYQSIVPMSQNVFRYNLSVNDGRDGYGGITVSGAGGNSLGKSAVFHNNTVVVDRSVVPNSRGAVWFISGNHADLDFFNNAFVALDGAALIAGDTHYAKSTFIGNSYWTDGGPIILEDVGYASVQSWALASLQERHLAKFVAITDDPLFSSDGSYVPGIGSPLLDSGLLPAGAPWPAWLTGLGDHDVDGIALFQGAGPDVGAREVHMADLDHNGRVDRDDVALWRYAVTVGGAAAALGDADGDGDADGADFLQLQRHLAGGSPFPFVGGQVPEPAGALVVLQCALLGRWATRRRRRIRGTWPQAS